MTIWKYELPIDGAVALRMPEGAIVLTVQDQRGTLCLWALVDPVVPHDYRQFRIIGSNNEFDAQGLHYIGTAQQRGLVVWHVFEVTA